jgi:hypothetical protein
MGAKSTAEVGAKRDCDVDFVNAVVSADPFAPGFTGLFGLSRWPEEFFRWGEIPSFSPVTPRAALGGAEQDET